MSLQWLHPQFEEKKYKITNYFSWGKESRIRELGGPFLEAK
jgi:hypothetical protein